MPDVTITTSFGSIQFSYSDQKDLDTALQQLEQQIPVIAAKTKNWIPLPARSPKPGYEHAYRFLPNGKIELLRPTDSAMQRVALALFAADPETLTPTEIAQITSIADPGAKTLQQTSNKIYFRKDGERYGLSPEGMNYISKNMPPKFPEPVGAPAATKAP